ncbi:MAG: hypothetical protein V9G10_05105 [Candidatus Nanopelagicales bacterium]
MTRRARHDGVAAGIRQTCSKVAGANGMSAARTPTKGVSTSARPAAIPAAGPPPGGFSLVTATPGTSGSGPTTTTGTGNAANTRSINRRPATTSVILSRPSLRLRPPVSTIAVQSLTPAH